MITATRTPKLALPVELTGTVPRDVRLTSAGLAVTIVAFGFVVAAIVVGIFLSIVYLRNRAEDQLRLREGLAVDGEVVQMTTRRGENPRRVVTYVYEVDGRRYSGTVTLRKSDRRLFGRGNRVPVNIVRSNPTHSWVTGYGSNDGIPIVVIPLVVSSLLGIGGLIVWRVRRQWVLLTEGRVAQAHVTAVKKINSDKHKTFRVTYEFRTISGATKTSRSDFAKAPPVVGAVIPIIYHRDIPEWSAAYPMQLVKPERLAT